MARTTSKAKQRRKPSPKAGKTRAKSKPLVAPLVAESGFVRTAAPRRKRQPSPAIPLTVTPPNPTVAIMGLMGRLVQIYATFPVRLAGCTSPIGFWREHTRLTHDVLTACHSAASDGPSMLVPPKARSAQSA